MFANEHEVASRSDRCRKVCRVLLVSVDEYLRMLRIILEFEFIGFDSGKKMADGSRAKMLEKERTSMMDQIKRQKEQIQRVKLHCPLIKKKTCLTTILDRINQSKWDLISL